MLAERRGAIEPFIIIRSLKGPFVRSRSKRFEMRLCCKKLSFLIGLFPNLSFPKSLVQYGISTISKFMRKKGEGLTKYLHSKALAEEIMGPLNEQKCTESENIRKL